MSRSFLALFAASILTAGCISTGTGQLGKNEPVITGKLDISGPTFGAVSFAPKACDSGEHQVFFGADFSSPESKVVARIVVDPLTGPGVRIFDQDARFEKALVLKKETCQSFHFALERSGWRINDIYVMKVHLDLDCTLPNGDSVKGVVDAASCF